MWRKLQLLLLTCLLLLVIAACSQVESGIQVEQSKIKKISLTCLEGCKQLESPPFRTKTFVDPKEISIFERALNESDTLNGVMDYIPYYKMETVDELGKALEYHLNVGIEKGRMGLIAPLSGVGALNVNEENSDALRELIYVNHSTELPTVINKLGVVTNLESLESFITHRDANNVKNLTITQYTIEGDPIYYRLTQLSDKIKLEIDSTKDKYGTNEVAKYNCNQIKKNETKRGIQFKLVGCDKHQEIPLLFVGK
jgi:hypothetical protein